jgi:hypothetical protein
MNKAISLAILAGGIILVAFGINAYESTSSDVSRFFTGAATDKSMWLLICGSVLSVFGIVSLLRGQKSM